MSYLSFKSTKFWTWLLLMFSISIILTAIWSNGFNCPAYSSEPSRSEKALLKGIREVTVLVEHPSPEASKFISMESIQRATELRLRQFGMRIVSKDAPNYWDVPCVYLNVDCLNPSLGVYPYSSRMELLEPAIVLRKGENHLVASYRKGSIGVAGGGVLSTSMASSAAELVDIFINDWCIADGR